mgnify:CR=1 FL=1
MGEHAQIKKRFSKNQVPLGRFAYIKIQSSSQVNFVANYESINHKVESRLRSKGSTPKRTGICTTSTAVLKFIKDKPLKRFLYAHNTLFIYLVSLQVLNQLTISSCFQSNVFFSACPLT